MHHSAAMALMSFARVLHSVRACAMSIPGFAFGHSASIANSTSVLDAPSMIQLRTCCTFSSFSARSAFCFLVELPAFGCCGFFAGAFFACGFFPTGLAFGIFLDPVSVEFKQALVIRHHELLDAVA